MNTQWFDEFPFDFGPAKQYNKKLSGIPAEDIDFKNR
jgi:hypothetical protein